MNRHLSAPLLCLLLFLISLPRLVSAGPLGKVIGTYAGKGFGDGGPATAASFNVPFCVTVDMTATLHIGDMFNNRVRKVTPGGTTSTLCGGAPGYSGDGGPASAAGINMPFAMAIARTGGLVFADTYDNHIHRIGSAATYPAGDGPIRYGWNLVSLPADPVVGDLLVVFSGIDVANFSLQYWKNRVEGGGF